MAAVDVLRSMKARLSTPTKWARGASARDKHGIKCHPTQERAVCWCLLGALGLAGEPGGDRLNAALILHDVLPEEFNTIPQFNDAKKTTHADVLSVLDKAIEQAS